MTASDAAASMTSDSLMPPTPLWMMLTGDLVLRQLGDLVLERLERAGDVGLEHEVELLELALLDALEEVVERDLAAGAAGLRLVLERGSARSSACCAGDAVVLDDAHVLAGVGDAVEAEDLDRVAGDAPRRMRAPM